ncbi:MAG: hypothetical protein P4L33_10530 [Capsulimonadaceae bacterium]|nr:hypothetical protein [Capsulimonadaceae bacterium]
MVTGCCDFDARMLADTFENSVYYDRLLRRPEGDVKPWERVEIDAIASQIAFLAARYPCYDYHEMPYIAPTPGDASREYRAIDAALRDPARAARSSRKRRMILRLKMGIRTGRSPMTWVELAQWANLVDVNGVPVAERAKGAWRVALLDLGLLDQLYVPKAQELSFDMDAPKRAAAGAGHGG